MKAPRVAFFTDSLHEVNGVALTSREFVQFAQRTGREFLAVCAGPQDRMEQQGSVRTIELGRSRAVLRLERDLSFDLLFYRYRAMLARQLEAFAPDLIHITGPSHIGMLGAILAHQFKVPLVASWHTNVHEFAGRRLEQKLQWLDHQTRHSLIHCAQNVALSLSIRYYRLARLLFAPNPELVEMLACRTGRPVFLMHRGIDTTLFSPERRRRTTSEFVIGFVGRLSPEKNVRLFARIEDNLRQAGVRDYRFLIVGDGSEKHWLQQNLKQADLPGVLSGPRLAEAYAGMDAFVFPSETDTFGNVVLEAMASGVPVVVSNEGGPKFLVRSKVNGYIADGFQPFVDALMDLRTHSHSRQLLADGARATAMSFSWDSVFEGIYERYSTILLPGEASAQDTRSGARRLITA
ncbi:MAG: glycosyltransferase [Bryobacteraceae bacterium]